MAARAMQPVPRTSSLKQAISGLYLSRILGTEQAKVSAAGCQEMRLMFLLGEDSQVDVGSWVVLPRRFDKSVNEIIVPFPTNARLAETKVELVF